MDVPFDGPAQGSRRWFGAVSPRSPQRADGGGSTHPPENRGRPLPRAVFDSVGSGCEEGLRGIKHLKDDMPIVYASFCCFAFFTVDALTIFRNEMGWSPVATLYFVVQARSRFSRRG